MVPKQPHGPQRGNHRNLLFQLSGYRCFKLFYKQAVWGAHLELYFPRTASCNRFVELMRHGLMPPVLYT